MTSHQQDSVMFKVYLTRTADRALYGDERVFMGTFESLDSAASALGSQFQFCEVISEGGDAR